MLLGLNAEFGEELKIVRFFDKLCFFRGVLQIVTLRGNNIVRIKDLF